jgi:hypothetical protein
MPVANPTVNGSYRFNDVWGRSANRMTPKIRRYELFLTSEYSMTDSFYNTVKNWNARLPNRTL